MCKLDMECQFCKAYDEPDLDCHECHGVGRVPTQDGMEVLEFLKTWLPVLITRGFQGL